MGVLLELLEDRGLVVRVAGLAHLLLVDGLGGVDALVHERLEALEVLEGAGGGGEVHDGGILAPLEPSGAPMT